MVDTEPSGREQGLQLMHVGVMWGGTIWLAEPRKDLGTEFGRAIRGCYKRKASYVYAPGN